MQFACHKLKCQQLVLIEWRKLRFKSTPPSPPSQVYDNTYSEGLGSLVDIPSIGPSGKDGLRRRTVTNLTLNATSQIFSTNLTVSSTYYFLSLCDMVWHFIFYHIRVSWPRASAVRRKVYFGQEPISPEGATRTRTVNTLTLYCCHGVLMDQLPHSVWSMD